MCITYRFTDGGIGPSLFQLYIPRSFDIMEYHLERDIVHFLAEKFLAFQLLTNGRLEGFDFSPSIRRKTRSIRAFL